MNFSFLVEANVSEAQPLQAHTLMQDLMLCLPHYCYTQRLFLGESLDDLDAIFWFLQGKERLKSRHLGGNQGLFYNQALA